MCLIMWWQLLYPKSNIAQEVADKWIASGKELKTCPAEGWWS